jgi:putative hydrolase of the HAD superfamily
MHIFFDLDHTLWDFERNATETLAELFFHFKMENEAELSDFVTYFHRINTQLWDLYNIRQITQTQLRERRFTEVFQACGLSSENRAAFETLFLQTCPSKPHLMPYALEVLKYLRDKGYRLHIITNGFPDTQQTKMQSGGIEGFFEEIFTSHRSGCHKPDQEMFDFALRHTGASASESFMVGDTLEADVLGALRAGMPAVYYNPAGLPHSYALSHEIRCLSELKRLF